MKKTILILMLFIPCFVFAKEEKINDFSYLNNSIKLSVDDFTQSRKKYLKDNYYNGEKITTIIKKINKYFNSTLKNKGEYVVKKSIKSNIDPYLVAAVMLQETGCQWTCSALTRKCNNVAGNKGTPSCGGGSYRKFNTINDGIDFAIKKLNSYYKKGLKTPQQINPYYATSKTWASKVNAYMKKLKNAKV